MGAVRYLSHGTRGRLLCHIRWAQATTPGAHTRALDVLPPSTSVLSFCTTATAPGPPLRCSPWASAVLHAAVGDTICFSSSVSHKVPTLLPRHTHIHTHIMLSRPSQLRLVAVLSLHRPSFVSSFFTILSLLTTAVCMCGWVRAWVSLHFTDVVTFFRSGAHVCLLSISVCPPSIPFSVFAAATPPWPLGTAVSGTARNRHSRTGRGPVLRCPSSLPKASTTAANRPRRPSRRPYTCEHPGHRA